MCLLRQAQKFVERLNDERPWSIHLMSVLLVFVYAILGGIAFMAIETKALAIQRQDDITTCLKLYLSKQNRSEDASKLDMNDAKELLAECMYFGELDDGWSLFGSALFSFGIITTLGVGRPAPITEMGKLFCISFGVVGIPLTMLVLANLGKAVKASYTSFRARLERRSFERELRRNRQRRVQRRTRWRTPYSLLRLLASRSAHTATDAGDGDEGEDEQVEEDSTVAEARMKAQDHTIETTGLTVLVMFAVYVVFGCILMAVVNQHSMINGAYSTFLSLTALEFKSLVPKKTIVVPIVLLYICLGIALTTVAMDIGSDYLKRFHFMGKKLTNASNTWIWFGGKRVKVKEFVATICVTCKVPKSVADNLDLNSVAGRAIRVGEGKETLPDWEEYGSIPPIDSEDEDDNNNNDFNGNGGILTEDNTTLVEISKRRYRLTPPPTDDDTTGPKTPPPLPFNLVNMSTLFISEELMLFFDTEQPVATFASCSAQTEANQFVVQSSSQLATPVDDCALLTSPPETHLGTQSAMLCATADELELLVELAVDALTPIQEALPTCSEVTDQLKDAPTTMTQTARQFAESPLTEPAERQSLAEADQHLLEEIASGSSSTLPLRRARTRTPSPHSSDSEAKGNGSSMFFKYTVAATSDNEPKNFDEKLKKYGTDSKKLLEVYQEEWSRYKTLQRSGATHRRNSAEHQ